MSQNPYRTKPATSFWSTGVKEPVTAGAALGIEPLLGSLAEGESVVSCGSCFAQYIGQEMQSRQLAFLRSSLSGDRVESLGTGNLYSAAQLRQWLEFATGKRSWADDTLHEAGGRFQDYLLPHREAVSSREGLISYRAQVADEALRSIADTDVFIFTIGLTETWRNRAGDVLPACPGTLFGEYDDAAHRFVNGTFDDILADLVAVEQLLAEINSRIRIILTVSPVPLTASASDEHVLVATTYSKSVLRAAVGQFCNNVARADYFPSYELINHVEESDWRFEKNLRSVSRQGVSYVMAHAFGDDVAARGKAPADERAPCDQEALCEEEMLDAYARSKTAPSPDADVFLVGDSHMQKLSKGFEENGVPAVGGQVMNGSGFSDHKFRLSANSIFVPMENEESKVVWNSIFERLSKLDAPCDIISNIGFQTHRTINHICNHYNTPVATLDQIADYFQENYSSHLDILQELKRFGTVWLVEDPNFYAFLTGKDVSTMIRDKNFPRYCAHLREMARERGIRYLAPCDLTLHRYFGEVGNFTDLVAADGFHGTTAYYRYSAAIVHEAISEARDPLSHGRRSGLRSDLRSDGPAEHLTSHQTGNRRELPPRAAA